MIANTDNSNAVNIQNSPFILISRDDLLVYRYIIFL